MQLSELVALFKEKGIAGAGGAGFPSYAKLNKDADILILNCAECEPLLKVHRQMLEKYAYEILSTLDTVAKALGGVKEVVICVKASYKGAVEAVNAEIGNFKNMRLHLLGEFYPAGDEVVTIYESTKRIVPPGKIPISVGVIVYNVETVFNMYKAINENKPVTHKYLTIAGEVENPITVKAPIGISFNELLKLAKVKNIDDVELVSGGPMTGKLVNKHELVTKTTNAVLVFPKNSFVINRKKANPSIDMKRAMSSCCQCSMCTDLCSRNLLGMPINPKEFMRLATTGVTKEVEPYVNTMFCSECGICEMFACPQGLAPKSLISIYKQKLRTGGVKPPLAEVGKVSDAREYRKVSMSRLITRLGIKKYNVSAPLTEEDIKTKEVRIMLSQTIGAPCVPVVKKGDSVKVGDLIAVSDKDKLGCNLHSSVDGVVFAVTDKFITVR